MPWLLASEKAIQGITALTVQEAIKSPSPLLAHIYAHDPNSCKKILIFMVSDVVAFLNVGKTMDAAQVIKTVELLMSDPLCRNLKPDDFKVMFDNAKKGYYGKNYDRIDGQVIFEWLNQYCQDRMNEVENLNISEHAKNKRGNTISPEMVEFYRQLSKYRQEAEKRANKGVDLDKAIHEKPERKKYEPSAREKFIQDCFKEFDQLCDKSPAKDERGEKIPGRFINWEGRIIDQVEYAEIKLRGFDLVDVGGEV